MNDADFLAKMENLFTALSDTTRLRLLNLMREDEVCVCFFTEVLGESQPKISRHLAYLRNADLVSSRREGKWMHYKIEMPNDENLAKIFAETLEALKQQKDMRDDYKKLIDICRSLSVPLTIARAPKPETLLETDILQKENEAQENAPMETFLL